MILKTAIKELSDPCLPNGTTVWMRYRRQRAYEFKCTCGRFFRLRDTNRFSSYDDIRCSVCKRKKRLSPDIGERYVFKRIKSDAVRGGRDFKLSLDTVIKLIHEPCHYCGRRNINSISVKSRVPGEFLVKNFRYNGIDRKDNDIGYTEENSIPCCVVCNRAKNSMGYYEFLDWIEDMIQYRRDNT